MPRGAVLSSVKDFGSCLPMHKHYRHPRHCLIVVSETLKPEISSSIILKYTTTCTPHIPSQTMLLYFNGDLHDILSRVHFAGGYLAYGTFLRGPCVENRWSRRQGVCFLREIAVLKIRGHGNDQLDEALIAFSNLYGVTTVPDAGTAGALLASDTNPN